MSITQRMAANRLPEDTKNVDMSRLVYGIDRQSMIEKLVKTLAKTANELDTLKCAWADYLHNKDNIGWAIEELVRDAENVLAEAREVLAKTKR